MQMSAQKSSPEVDWSLPRPAYIREKKVSATIVMLAVVLVGSCLRVAFLTYYPSGIGGHALGHTTKSLWILDTLYPALLTFNWTDIKSVMDFVLSEQHGPQSLIESFGFLLMGAGLEQAYANVAIIGSLTLVVAYAAVALMFGKRAGIACALFLSVAWWHLKLSRHGEIEHVLSPFMFFLSCWSSYRAILLCTLKSMLLAGVICGLNLYVYAPNQVLLAALPLLVLILPLLKSSRLLPALGYLAVYGVSMLVVAAPQLLHNYHVGKAVPLRSSYGTDTYDFVAMPRILRQVGDFFRGLVTQVDDPWFYRDGGAFTGLDITLMLFGFLVLLSALRNRAKRNAALTVLLLLIVTPLPAIIGIGAPFRRGLLFACTCVMLMSLAADKLADWWLSRKIPLQLRALVLAAVMSAFMFQEARAYFRRPDSPESSGALQMTEVVRYVESQMGDHFLVMLYPASIPHYADHYRYCLNMIAHQRLQALQRAHVAPESRVAVMHEQELVARLPSIDQQNAKVEVVATVNDARTILELSRSDARLSQALAAFTRFDLLDKAGQVVGVRFQRP